MQDIQDNNIQEYTKALIQYHKITPRHVLVLDTNPTQENKQTILKIAENQRKASNELTHYMHKQYKQLTKTKQYKGLLKAYNKTQNKKNTQSNRQKTPSHARTIPHHME